MANKVQRVRSIQSHFISKPPRVISSPPRCQKFRKRRDALSGLLRLHGHIDIGTDQENNAKSPAYTLSDLPAIAAGLTPVQQQVVEQYTSHHRLAYRHGTDAHAGVMAPLGYDLGRFAGPGNGLAGPQD